MILLRRTIMYKDGPTYGEIIYALGRLCDTLELPWRDNQHDISCVPPGDYQVIPHHSEKHPDCWEITGVKDRFGILIHPANHLSELKGCVAPGMNIAPDGIAESRKAMSLLRHELPRSFPLRITNP